MTKQFTAFAEKHGIEITATPIPERTDGSDWTHAASHWRCTVKLGKHTLWVGEYSKGIGHAERWAETKGKNHRVIAKDVSAFTKWREYYPKPWNKRYSRRIEEALAACYAQHTIPEIGEVLYSLQMDTMGCDQPFEDWAPELGYDEDSIKAKQIWETYNDIRRTMQRAMTREQWDEFVNLEDE